jgi:uncharacterized protein (UPF0332 family)
MVKEKTLEETYDLCLSEGNFIPQQNIDKFRIQSTLKIIEEDLSVIEDLKNSSRYHVLCKLTYDVLHSLAEILLSLEKIKSKNHQCLFSYLCLKYLHLELSWEFFEKIRTKRNGIHYYGTIIDKSEWNNINFQAGIYINILKKEINSLINKHNK